MRRNKRPNGNRQDKATLALRIANRLQQQVEKKYLDDISGSGTVDWDGKFITLNAINQGQSDTQRVGDKVFMKELKCTFRMELPSGADATNLRVMVIFDKQDTLIQSSNVLNTTGNSLSTISDLVWDRRHEFIVLRDFRMAIHPYKPRINFTFVQPINRGTQFASGSIQIQTGSLHLLLISDTSPVSTLPTVSHYCRLQYTDL